MPARPADRGLVVFDCDGVLVDSEELSQRVLRELIAGVGVVMSDEEVRAEFMGPTLREIAAGVEARLGSPLPADWTDRFVAARAVAFDAELRAVPGARSAVEGVRALGFATCVASQGRVSKSQMTLGMTGLRDLFTDEQLFSATMVARGKPAPDLFLHAAGTCGFAPAECIVVEDTVNGVRAARAAGMRAIGYTGTAGADALVAEGAEPVDDMRDVPALVAAVAADARA